MEINKDEIRCICSILFPRSPIGKHTISLTFLVVWEKEVTNVISPLLQMRKPRSEKRKWKTKSTVVWVTEQEKRNWVLETVIISRAYEYPWIIKSKVKPNCFSSMPKRLKLLQVPGWCWQMPPRVSSFFGPYNCVSLFILW